MIDLFYRRPANSKSGHPRVKVTTLPNAEAAQALVEALSFDDGSECPTVGGRASRRRGTVAQLVARRDKALDREIRAKAAKRLRAAIKIVQS